MTFLRSSPLDDGPAPPELRRRWDLGFLRDDFLSTASRLLRATMDFRRQESCGVSGPEGRYGSEAVYEAAQHNLPFAPQHVLALPHVPRTASAPRRSSHAFRVRTLRSRDPGSRAYRARTSARGESWRSTDRSHHPTAARAGRRSGHAPAPQAGVAPSPSAQAARVLRTKRGQVHART